MYKKKIVRQFSLQCETPIVQQRRVLKKQLSEDLQDAEPEINIRISVSAKNRPKIADRPAPFKIAWTENGKFDDPEETKPKQNSFDSVIYSPKLEKPHNESSKTSPKIILPLKPEALNNENLKSVFQRRIRKAMKQKFNQSCFSPTTDPSRPNTIVIPVIEPPKKIDSNRRPFSRQNSVEKPEEEKPSRPSTAASKREMFQKRTNSAFHGAAKGENFRPPPLVRAASMPIRPEPSKAKFVATKRRIKTAKAKIDAFEDENDGYGRGRFTQRCVSVTGGDVVTMVSLVSPSGSDNEEEERQEKLNTATASPKENQSAKIEEVKIEQKGFSLRKTVKSVSFQQSSIHAVRSFSASFPARRCSVATTLMIRNSSFAKDDDRTGSKIQEKRAQIGVHEEGERVPKRRLVRTKSAPLQRSTENDDGENEKNAPTSSEPSMTIETKTNMDVAADVSDIVKDVSGETSISEETKSKLENPKEKQCWDMFCKMNEKGVAISYDTILRGMLTPTEYRLRKKTSVPEDNCEITDN